MPEGITVLMQEEIYSPNIAAMVIVFIVSVIVLLVIENYFNVYIDAAIWFLACIFIAVIVGAVLSKPSGTYKYKVLIDDNVRFVEFHNLYEVIDQDGDIFTVEERNKEE